MAIKLQTVQNEGQAAVASYTTAAALITIPSNAVPWAQAVFRHTGTAGKWYGRYAGGTPTTTVHDFVLGPGEPHQMDNPPKGIVSLLASSDAVGALEWEIGWST